MSGREQLLALDGRFIVPGSQALLKEPRSEARTAG